MQYITFEQYLSILIHFAMKTEERKTWEREQRIGRLVDIAQELFFSKGYDETTMEDIAGAAGYAKRSMYLYFKDKEDLLLAVVLRGQRIFKSSLQESLVQCTPGDSLVHTLGKAFYKFSIDHPEFFNLIMIYESRVHRYYAPDGFADDGSNRAKCQVISEEYGNLVIAAIKDDIDHNRISTRLDARQLMLIIWGEAFGVMQVILMRKQMFQDAYGISHGELFGEFLRMAGRSLL